MKATLYVQNLKCGGCASTITKNITSIESITDVLVTVDESSVTFEYPTETKLLEVKAKLAGLGYPEDGELNSLGSKAKSYVSCAIGKIG